MGLGQPDDKLENLPSRDDKKACSAVKFGINQCRDISLIELSIMNY